MTVSSPQRTTGALRRPAIKPIFRVETVEPDGVLLLSERGHYVLQGALFRALVPLLDGRLTSDEIVDRLVDRAEPATVYYALLRLQQRGYLFDADSSLTPEQAAFWSALDLEPAAAQARAGASTISLVTVGEVREDLADALGTTLAGLGVRVARQSPGSVGGDLARPDACGLPGGWGGDLARQGDITIVLTTDYLEPDLADLNVAALASGRPWLLVKPLGTIPWIGPLFRPSQTGCWECLAERLRSNREVEAFLQRRRGVSAAPFPVGRGALPASVALALRLAALEAARALAGAEVQPTLGALLTLDLLTVETRRHVLVRRPQCPRCGELDASPARPARPPALVSRPKRFTADGGHRAVPPDETLARFGHHVSPITGVVGALTRVETGHGLLHAYQSTHRTHGRRDTLFYLRRRLGSGSSGKGMTDTQAQASALCEALERYSLQFHGDEIRRAASLRELGADAIHPNACLLVSEAQFRNRQEWNSRGSRYNRVPDPFDETARVEWSPVWSLTEGHFKYLPTELLYAGYREQPGPPRYAWADSSGGAAGNSLEEAILQGFLELVERDTVAIWWYNRARRPALDLDSFDDPYVHDVRRLYRQLNRELWVLDLTADLEIPTFAALSRCVGRPTERIVRGFGAHFDPRLALLRALTELNQNLALAGVDGDEGEHPVDDPDARAWIQHVTVADEPYLLPAEGPSRRRSWFAATPSADLRDDVERCRTIVEARGLEMLVLDATRPDIGLPVVKVLVPGLRPAWVRFAPGRLYDVPVRLGWLDRPLREDELNPRPYVP